MKIIFLGETFRADAKSWINGIEMYSNSKMHTLEIPVYKYRIFRIFSSFIFLLKCLITYFQKSYDISLAERSTSYGFFSLFVNSRVKVVAQQGITDIYPPTLFSKVFKAYLQKITYKNVDLIHSWGSVMVPEMLRSCAHPSKIIIKPKGINLNFYSFKFKHPNIFKNTIIVTRSLEKDYRHIDIIEAGRLLKDYFNVEFKITIVGSGSLYRKMVQLVNKYNLSDCIDFVGRIPNESLPELLKQHFIYLSVPETEGVSSSLMEAMASGCIPVVTDLPGNRAFIKPGYNGELVKIMDPEDIASKILHVLKNSDKYRLGILQNRKWIEKNANFHVNMKYFFNLYNEKLNQKCAG
ncbi:MAG: glycosyltransferase [Thermoplasmata archaeon]